MTSEQYRELVDRLSALEVSGTALQLAMRLVELVEQEQRDPDIVMGVSRAYADRLESLRTSRQSTPTLDCVSNLIHFIHEHRDIFAGFIPVKYDRV